MPRIYIPIYPPPYIKPFSYLNMPVDIPPHIPTPKWIVEASKGSSIFNFHIVYYKNINIAPEASPIIY